MTFGEAVVAIRTVPPVNLNGDLDQDQKLVDTYHQEAMGTGFNFDMVDDPVEALLKLNEIAIAGSQSGHEDRPVGKHGYLQLIIPESCFIGWQSLCAEHIDWKFNISVDTPELFWMAAASGSQLHLRDGVQFLISALPDLIVRSSSSLRRPRRRVHG